MSRAVLDGMARLLADAGVGAYSTTEVLPEGAVPITVGATPPDGVEAVTLTTYAGGAEPDARNGWEYPRLQVRVRAADALAALDLDRACFDVLQAASGALDATWHLQDCYALQSNPEPLGPDDSGRPEYVRNYQLDVEPAAGNP